MSIYVQGTKKTITEQMIMEAAEGELCQTYKKPLRYIHLTWKHWNLKKIGNRSKYKGFEDTFLTLLSSGGITIKHRIPGSAQFIKNPIGGKYVAVLADTEHNRMMLASTYKDGLWTIREADVDEWAKVESDKIDERLKKKRVRYNVDVPEYDEKGHVIDWKQQVVEESAYEFEKKNREKQFKKGSPHKMYQHNVQPMEITEEKPDYSKEKADIEKKKAELAEREARIRKAEEALKGDIETIKDEKADLNTEYDAEELSKMRPVSKLRKIAKELGTEKDTSKLKTPDLVAEIMELQAMKRVEATVDESEEVETVTS